MVRPRKDNEISASEARTILGIRTGTQFYKKMVHTGLVKQYYHPFSKYAYYRRDEVERIAQLEHERLASLNPSGDPEDEE